MRKHPLIALTAFTALTASAIAGVSTGNFASNSVLTSSRTHQPAAQKAAAAAAQVPTVAKPVYHRPPFSRDLTAIHSDHRPMDLLLSPRTGLPVHKVKVKVKPKPKPVVTPAPPPAPVVPAPVVTTTTLPPVTTTTVPSTGGNVGGAWYELRMCESGDNYAENTGNGYYGAYQFSLSTWYGLGYSGLPSDASPATQDQAAQTLQAEAGWGQWPACSAKLGL